jgi:hypothetical protein
MLFNGIKLIESDPSDASVCVLVIEGSKLSVKFEAEAVNNLSDVMSVLPVLIEKAPVFRLNVPETAD